MTDENTKKTCPVCNRDEIIQRLSAIVASGTASGTFSGPSGGVVRSGNETGTYGGYTTLSGTSMSNLARSLSLSNEPKFPIIQEPVMFTVLLIAQVMAGIGTLGIGFIIFFFVWVYVASMGPIVIGDQKKEIAKYAKRLAQWRLAKKYWLSLDLLHK